MAETSIEWTDWTGPIRLYQMEIDDILLRHDLAREVPSKRDEGETEIVYCGDPEFDAAGRAGGQPRRWRWTTRKLRVVVDGAP